MSATFRGQIVEFENCLDDEGFGLNLGGKIPSLFLRFSFLCFSWAVFVFVILLIAADPIIEEWNQIIATVQRYNLAWLNLNGNGIDVIPDSIAQLRNLKTLYLYGVNCVIVVCMQLCAHITGNEIEKLPDSIGDLASLKFFHISGMFNCTLSVASSQHRQQDQHDS